MAVALARRTALNRFAGTSRRTWGRRRARCGRYRVESPKHRRTPRVRTGCGLAPISVQTLSLAGPPAGPRSSRVVTSGCAAVPAEGSRWSLFSRSYRLDCPRAAPLALAGRPLHAGPAPQVGATLRSTSGGANQQTRTGADRTGWERVTPSANSPQTGSRQPQDQGVDRVRLNVSCRR